MAHLEPILMENEAKVLNFSASGGASSGASSPAGGGGCARYVHGRSRMTIDPRILTMPGRSTSGLPTTQALLAPSAKRREVFGSRMKGELHLSNNRS